MSTFNYALSLRFVWNSSDVFDLPLFFQNEFLSKKSFTGVRGAIVQFYKLGNDHYREKLLQEGVNSFSYFRINQYDPYRLRLSVHSQMEIGFL